MLKVFKGNTVQSKQCTNVTVLEVNSVHRRKFEHLNTDTATTVHYMGKVLIEKQVFSKKKMYFSAAIERRDENRWNRPPKNTPIITGSPS